MYTRILTFFVFLFKIVENDIYVIDLKFEDRLSFDPCINYHSI